MSYTRINYLPQEVLSLPTVDSATAGAIATFNTDLNLPLFKCVCSITASQNLHGYDHPWAGGAGKNKFNNSVDNITEGSNICAISGNVIRNTGSNAYDAVRFEQPLIEGNYVIHASNISANGIIRVDYYDGSYENVGFMSANSLTLTFTMPANTTLRISIYSSEAGGMSVTKLQCELGSTPSAYEPYSNICPIVGHSELNLVRCGANLVDFNLKPYSNADEFWLPQGNYYCTLERASGMSTAWYFGAVKTDGTYCSKSELGLDDWSVSSGGYCYGNADKDYFSFSIPDGVSSIKIGRLNADNTIGVMINVGSTALPYSPYNGTTFTVQFGQTVYGGVYDANRGKVKPNVYYPSYNGETITGRWLSSKDVYVEGNTPTTGAQVVCLDEYDTEIDVSELSVDTIVGVNNVFADTGEVEQLTYFESVGMKIQKGV